jgi:hypothetical protein
MRGTRGGFRLLDSMARTPIPSAPTFFTSPFDFSVTTSGEIN